MYEWQGTDPDSTKTDLRGFKSSVYWLLVHHLCWPTRTSLYSHLIDIQLPRQCSMLPSMVCMSWSYARSDFPSNGPKMPSNIPLGPLPACLCGHTRIMCLYFMHIRVLCLCKKQCPLTEDAMRSCFFWPQLAE